MFKASRWATIVLALLICAGVLWAGGQKDQPQKAETKPAKEGFDWTAYSGATMRIIHPSYPYIRVVEPSAWEKLSNMVFCFSSGIPIPVSLI